MRKHCGAESQRQVAVGAQGRGNGKGKRGDVRRLPRALHNPTPREPGVERGAWSATQRSVAGLGAEGCIKEGTMGSEFTGQYGMCHFIWIRNEFHGVGRRTLRFVFSYFLPPENLVFSPGSRSSPGAASRRCFIPSKMIVGSSRPTRSVARRFSPGR